MRAVAPEPLARSAGGLTLTLTGRTLWTGSSERPRVAGADLHLRVVSPRRRVGGEVTVMARAAEGVDVAADLNVATGSMWLQVFRPATPSLSQP